MLLTMSSSTGDKREALACSEDYRVSASTEFQSTSVAYNSLTAERDVKTQSNAHFTHHRVAECLHFLYSYGIPRQIYFQWGFSVMLR